MSDSSARRRLTEYEIQVQDLQAYVTSLEKETLHLRKKLDDTPKEFMIIENKLREANRQLVQAFNQNEKLVNALYEAREQITALKEEVDKRSAPPASPESGRPHPHGRQVGLPPREAPEERGRGSRARGSAGHRLRADRRPRHPARDDQGRRRAAVPLRGLLQGAQAHPAQGGL